MITFYDPDCSEDSRSLPEHESRHAIKSLRMRVNEAFDVINGKGLKLHAILKSEHKRLVQFEVTGLEKKEKKSPYLHMAVSPLKQTDRFEYFIEKATELGVDEISPIFCKRTEKPRIKVDRLERIIISAIKQSGNAFKPVLKPLISFDEFIAQDLSALKYIAHCKNDNKLPLHKLQFKENTVIAIGPEGDFNENEIQSAIFSGFQSISLGDLTLRSETAALSACAYFQLCR